MRNGERLLLLKRERERERERSDLCKRIGVAMTDPEKARPSSRVPVQKSPFVNPPDRTNPDPATLREQWRFAVRQYSKAYAQSWGTAILAGLSFFALGWFIKGTNPLPSRHSDSDRKDAPP